MTVELDHAENDLAIRFRFLKASTRILELFR